LEDEEWFIARGTTVMDIPVSSQDFPIIQHRWSNTEHIKIADETALLIHELLEQCEKLALATVGIAIYPLLGAQDENTISYRGKVNDQMSRNPFRKNLTMTKFLASPNAPNEAVEVAGLCSSHMARIRTFGHLVFKTMSLGSTSAIALGFEPKCKDVSSSLTLFEP
jgi:hypothetical protein